MTTTSLTIAWRPREEPLAPSAVAAVGAVARALAVRLLAATDESLAALRGVAAPGVLVVLGAREALPWVDGVVYLGGDPRAGGLLLPATLEPSVPVELVARAFAARFGPVSPVAVLPAAELAIPLASARPVARAALARWLEGEA
jgi:hypothetical protein